MLKNNSGETLAEALVGFMIAALSVTALLVSVLTSEGLIQSGIDSIDTFYNEEELLDRFLRDDNIPSETGKLTVIADDKIFTVSDVQIYISERYKITGFKKPYS